MSGRVKSTKGKGIKSRLIKLAIAAAVVLAAALIEVYVTRSETWESLFGKASGGAPVSGEVCDSGEGAANADEDTGGGDAVSDDLVSLTVMYVGQGDGIFIKAGESNILVDAGVRESYDYIDGFLKDSGVERIDCFFASHPHADHIGSFAKLASHYEIGEVIMNSFDESLTPTNSTYEYFLDTLERLDIPVRQAVEGEELWFDKGTMEVISAGMYSDLNNSSLVLCFRYGDTSFLLTGDCEYEAEDDLLARGLIPRCDVLKAGHHGTKNATSMDFLNAVSPEYVAVSCGIDNDYGYPKEKFMNRVERAGAALFRTDTDGNITFLTDGVSVEVVTGSHRADGQ